MKSLGEVLDHLRQVAADHEAKAGKCRHAIQTLEELDGPAPAAALNILTLPPTGPALIKTITQHGFKKGHRTAGKPAKPGDKTCKACGRAELKSVPGPGGYLAFHYAKDCGLPCSGANLKKLPKEDIAGGVHTSVGCSKCKRVAYK